MSGIPRIAGLNQGSINKLTRLIELALAGKAPSDLSSGVAGGDLVGSYPNPNIKFNVHLPGDPTTSTQPPGDNSTKIATTAYADAAGGGGGGPPSGPAGGDLSGTYPNPSVAQVLRKAIKATIISKSSAYAALATDDIILVSGSTTITLPTTVAAGTRSLTIKKADAAGTIVTILRGIGTDNIEGAASITLTAQYQEVTLVSDAAGTWWIIGTGRGLTNADIAIAAAIDYAKLALTNSIINADVNTGAAIAYSKLNLSGSVVNADIAAAAAIAYTKLNLAGSIVNADVAAAAAIAYSKLNLAGSIKNADIAVTAAIAYAKLSLANSIVDGDINAAAAIAYSKLALAGSIVNADVSATAAIAYSKLSLAASIKNADIAATAAIAYSKLNLAASIVNADIAAAAAIAYSKLALANSVKNGDLVPKTGTLADTPPGRELTYDQITALVTISATTEATANAIATSTTFTFDGSTAVWIEAWFPDATSAVASTLTLILWDNTAGVSLGLAGVFTIAASGATGPINVRRKITPVSGARIYSIRGFRGASNLNVNAGAGGVGVKLPGFITIVRAG